VVLNNSAINKLTADFKSVVQHMQTHQARPTLLTYRVIASANEAPPPVPAPITRAPAPPQPVRAAPPPTDARPAQLVDGSCHAAAATQAPAQQDPDLELELVLRASVELAAKEDKVSDDWLGGRGVMLAHTGLLVLLPLLSSIANLNPLSAAPPCISVHLPSAGACRG